MTPSPSPIPEVVALLSESDHGAPWWGVPVVAGGFLLLGGVVGYFFNRLQDDRRVRREKAERWDQDLLNYASNAMSIARQFIQDCLEHDTVVGAQAGVAVKQMKAGERIDMPFIDEPSGRAMSNSFDALMLVATSLRLVAPLSVRTAVTNLQTAATHLLTANVHQRGIFDEVQRLQSTSTELEESVRKHFGIE